MASDPDTWVMLDDEKYDRDDDVPAAWTEKEDKKLAIYYDIINKAHHKIGFDKRHKYKNGLDKIISYFRESENDKFKNVHTAQLTYFYTNLKKFKQFHQKKYGKNIQLKGLIDSIMTYIWEYFYVKVIDIFADICYGYCITTHKSQGSTFRNVYIDINNIITKNSNEEESYRCLYTAITRSSKKVNILSYK